MKQMPQVPKEPSESTESADAVDKADLPDAQSLRDALKSWQKGDSEESNQDAESPAVPTRKVGKNQARRYARQRTLQALYQWDLGAVDASEVLNQFKAHQNLNNVDLELFQTLFRGVALSVDEVDALLVPALDRPVEDLDPIERSVLRMAACELRDCLETPARVVINEAVELTKRFGADQGHKYVNGVIDKVAMAQRSLEMKSAKSRD